jgi:quinol monooxygenase YgiN
MISVIVSGVGAILAAVGGGVLLARCFRQPRGDLIAWAIALLGLLVSLGCQVLGHLTGFDAAMFRGMELGGQVVAPLAAVLAMSEVAARSAPVRFCARLYLAAIALVAVVILSLDQLAQGTFTKAWPDPAVFYQLPPDYVLMFAIGPLTVLVAGAAVLTVLARSGQPGWNAVLPAELMGGAAALALAYPCLAQLAGYVGGIHLPVASEFAVLCVLAAGLGWLAADRAGRVRLSALHGASSAGAPRGPQPDGFGGRGPADGHSQFGPGSGYDGPERGSHRDDGQYWPDEPGRPGARGGRSHQDADGYGWQDDRGGRGNHDWRPREDDGQHWDGYPGIDATGDFAPGDFSASDPAGEDFGSGDLGSGDLGSGDLGSGDFATGDFATGDFATGDFAPGGSGTADHDPGYRAVGWRPDDRWQDEQAGAPDGQSRAGADSGSAQLFGQIAIYTLLEDRVEEFDQLTGRVVDQVRSREPDTLVFIVHAVPSAPMQRILYEVYRDRAAYQRHLEQPYVKQFDADRRPLVLATNIIELGLQQAKVSQFPSVADLFGEPGYDTSGFERPDFLRDYGRTSGSASASKREYR